MSWRIALLAAPILGLSAPLAEAQGLPRGVDLSSPEMTAADAVLQPLAAEGEGGERRLEHAAGSFCRSVAASGQIQATSPLEA